MERVEVKFIDESFIKLRKEVLITSLFEELHLDALLGDAGYDDGSNFAEISALQNGVEKDFVGVKIFSCEVSEHVDVLRAPCQRQFDFQRIIVCVDEQTIF